MVNEITPLRIYRIAKGFSQSQLADRIGTYQVHYSRIERGVTLPLPEEAAAIAQALGVSITDIFPNLVQVSSIE